MAVEKSILKVTHQDAVVCVRGHSGSAVIDLDVDLLIGTQVISGTPTVNIVGITWTGSPAGSADVTRGQASPKLAVVPGAAPGELDFSGQNMVPITDFNTTDITVTIAGVDEMQVWLRLRKVDGFATTVEPEQFGHYDNPNVAGS